MLVKKTDERIEELDSSYGIARWPYVNDSSELPLPHRADGAMAECSAPPLRSSRPPENTARWGYDSRIVVVILFSDWNRCQHWFAKDDTSGTPPPPVRG